MGPANTPGGNRMQHLLTELAKFGLLIITAPGLIGHAGKAVQIYTCDRLALVDPLAEAAHVEEALTQLRARELRQAS